MFRFKTLALSALVLLGAGAAHAQDSATRLNQLGRYAGMTASCKLAGFETTEDADRFAQAAFAEAAKSGFSEALSETYLTNAMTQAAAAAHAAVKGDQENGPKFAAQILGVMREWIATCHQIGRDPIGRILVTDDTNMSDDVRARTAADELLWTTGYASWQNAYIRAAGDMAYGVTVCGNHLTRPQYEAYLAPLRAPNAFPAAIKDRAERYMRFWTSQGEHDAEELGFDAGQCKKILTERAAALKATPR